MLPFIAFYVSPGAQSQSVNPWALSFPQPWLLANYLPQACRGPRAIYRRTYEEQAHQTSLARRLGQPRCALERGIHRAIPQPRNYPRSGVISVGKTSHPARVPLRTGSERARMNITQYKVNIRVPPWWIRIHQLQPSVVAMDPPSSAARGPVYSSACASRVLLPQARSPRPSRSS